MDFVSEEEVSGPYAESEVTVEPAGNRDVWEAATHLALELERVERTINFRVILTKM